MEGLDFNLLSLSQMCEKGNKAVFTLSRCNVINFDIVRVTLTKPRISYTYVVYLYDIKSKNRTCLKVNYDECWLWQRRVDHANMHIIDKISKHELVRGLPKCYFMKDRVYDECVKGKRVKASFKSIKFLSTTRPLELLHMG